MLSINSKLLALRQFIAKDANVDWQTGSIPICQMSNFTPAMEANQYYYDHPEWAKGYFKACHRDQVFQERWQSAIDCWDDKIVVDIGCGPGNLFATLGGSPRLMIGVDISHTSLEMAQTVGYTPILADAQNLPFIDSFADIVVVNATLHHCDDMTKTLLQAARLVRPGGLLITDHDPQQTAWNWKGLGMLLYKIRVPIYRLLSGGNFMSPEEHNAMLATETYHKPGHGLTPQFYYQVLEARGFTVKVYPHNHTLGAEVLQGNYGRSVSKYRLSQWLSGINSDLPEAALSLMCIAKRNLR
ncbi:class I SAM-dependent methyltransferase [Nostocales cyanobacterium LEGE 11386]|nr:class I SAM-dependent methyltransferase [Nostocales cyanobacterium LEGE 11386]